MKRIMFVVIAFLLVGCVPEYESSLSYYENWEANNEELFLLSLSQDDLYFFSIDPSYEQPGGKLVKENLLTGKYEVISTMENGIIFSLVNIEKETYVIESFINDEGLITWQLKRLDNQLIIDWGVEVEYKTVPKLSPYKEGFVYLKRNSSLSRFQVLHYTGIDENEQIEELFSLDILSGRVYSNKTDLFVVSTERTLEKVKFVYNDEGKQLGDVDHMTQFAAIDSGLLISEPTTEWYRCQNKIVIDKEMQPLEDNYCISGLNTVFGNYVLSLRENMVLQQYDGEKLISKNDELPQDLEEGKEYLGISDGEVTVLIGRINKNLYKLK